MADRQKTYAEKVAETLIAALEAGTAPWQKPWAPGAADFMPYNPTTGKRYRGINALMLMASGQSDQRWLTYKQAQAEGAQVRKGEHGTPIQYWQFTAQEQRRDEDGRLVIDPSTNKPFVDEVRLERPRVFFATVFNAAQIDGMPPIQPAQAPSWNPVERAEAILAASGADIRHVEGNRAFYSPARDFIQLPNRGQFDDASKYYATALHELGHWTGHPDRLNRDLAHPFGSEGYAREELRAEIASLIVGNETGIGHDPSQHAAYVASWIKVLREDPLEIFRAAADAEKVSTFLIGLEQQHKQAIDNKAEMDLNPPTNSEIGLAPGERIPTPGNTDVEQALYDWDRSRRVRPDDEVQADAYDILKRTPALLQYDDTARILPLMTDAAAAALRYHEDGPRIGNDDVLASLERWGKANFADIGGDFMEKARIVKADTDGTPDQIAVEAARVREVRDREEAQSLNPAATLEDRTAIHTERRDIENQAARTAEQSRRQQSGQGGEQRPEADSQAEQPTYLQVPYKEKDQAKALGAKWDRKQQSWFAPPRADLAKFSRWLPSAEQKAEQDRTATAAQKPAATAEGQDRTYLAVPYVERAEAKALGAQWDKGRKSWYAPPGADLAQFVKWKPENVPAQQGPAMTPDQEFAEVLRSLNLVVNGKHPIMDGQRHRIPAADDKAGEQSGFYVGHLDGHPAGYAKNNRTGTETRWKSQGYHISDAEKAQLAAQAAATQQRRAREQELQYDRVAADTQRRLATLADVRPGDQTPYLSKKGVDASAGIYRDGDATVIPAYDADGHVWTAQTIGDPKLGGGSVKSFAKDGRKAGSFHALGGLAALAQAPAIVIAEGYATAASLRDGAGFATVCAFDAGNMPAVARALAAKFPDKPVILAADADSISRDGKPVTVGREKAQEAAEAVGGTVVLPIFRNPPSPGVKPPTDFNDAAAEDEHGRESVSRQIRAAVQTALVRQSQKHAQRAQVQNRDPQKVGRELEGAGVGEGRRIRRAM